MTMLGYGAGRAIPGIEHYIEYVIVVIVLLSVLPMVLKYLGYRYRMRAAARDTH